jgi:hypothetical protein
MENGDSARRYLAVGDPGRPLIRRAIAGTLLAAFVFSATAGPVKQVKVLYDHAPWLNDPYDVVVSFAMFFVPFFAACCLARVLLCRQSEVLPTERISDLLRGCRVVLGLILVTLVTEWASVGLGANRARWSAATWFQIAILLVTTVVTVKAAADLYRAPAPRLAGLSADAPAVDWLADALALAGQYSRWLGRRQRAGLAVIAWTDRVAASRVRRHPVWSAAIAAVAFGVVVGGWQAVREGYPSAVALLAISLLACGTFAVLVGAGGYLGLVRSGSALAGAARRALDAGVVSCTGVLVVLAFRNSLWWLVGSHAGSAGVLQMSALLGIGAVSFFSVVFGSETLLRAHQPAVH